MREHKTLLTLEERLALAARSQASSPEAAVRLVRQLAQTHTASLLMGRADMDRMLDLTGEFWECLEDDLLHYSGFCRSFQPAMEQDNDFFRLASHPEDIDPLRPVWGVRMNNAILLLGLMLMDHAKGRQRDREVYHCTRMTLGQYLNALEALTAREEPEYVRTWRDAFWEDCDSAAPLGGALEDILRRYIAGWQVFDRLDHILRCMDGLSDCLEREAQAELDRPFREAMRQCIAEMGLVGVEVVEEDERLPDPCGHYLALALGYPEAPPDPFGEDAAPGSVRSQLFLADRDYRPQALRARCEASPSPELRALLEELIDPERLAAAMKEVNRAVIDLYMLWVDPYLRMENGPTGAGLFS